MGRCVEARHDNRRRSANDDARAHSGDRSVRQSKQYERQGCTQRPKYDYAVGSQLTLHQAEPKRASERASANRAQESAIACRALRHLAAGNQRQKGPRSASEQEERHGSRERRSQKLVVGSMAQAGADCRRQMSGGQTSCGRARRATPYQRRYNDDAGGAIDPERSSDSEPCYGQTGQGRSNGAAEIVADAVGGYGAAQF